MLYSESFYEASRRSFRGVATTYSLFPEWYVRRYFDANYDTCVKTHVSVLQQSPRIQHSQQSPRIQDGRRMPKWSRYYHDAIENGANKECAASEAGVTTRVVDYEREVNIRFVTETIRRRQYAKYGRNKEVELYEICRKYGLFYSLGLSTGYCIEHAIIHEKEKEYEDRD